MTNLNKTLIDTTLQAAVDAITTATSSTSLLLTAATINSANVDKSNYVNTTADLPDLYNQPYPNGEIKFVNELARPVISNNCCWISLERGTTVRNDVPRFEIWGWGGNCNGYLGDNSTVSKSSPVIVVGGFTDWVQVSGKGGYTGPSVGLRSNGTIWTWGRGTYGQLGINSTAPDCISSPRSVVGGFTNWCQISSGNKFAVALRTDGTIWSWGSGQGGYLGDGTAINRSSPVSVVGGFTDWCQVAAGGSHTLAIRANGTVWAWGVNGSTAPNQRGALGDNSATTCRLSPVSVVGGYTDWCQVAAGQLSSAAIRTNGELWTWGYNRCGQLGHNTVTSRSSPVSVVGGFTDWCQVHMQDSVTAAIRTNGSLWSWGYNRCGQLGDGTIIHRSSPVSVVGGFTDWCQVDNSLAAIRSNGSLWTWGYNGKGRLGDGTTVNKSSPISVTGGFSDWTQIVGDATRSLAIRTYTVPACY